MGKEIEGYALPGNAERKSGMAMVYVARPSSQGPWIRFNVFAENAGIDSLEAGYTLARQHLWFNINPGRHRLLTVAENTGEVDMDFKADSTYFFRQDVTPGFFMARNRLEETDSIEGTWNVMRTRPGTRLRTEMVVTDTTLRYAKPERNATGFELLADFRTGGMTGGPQRQSGLVSDNGDKASIGKTGFGIAMRFFFLEQLGLSAETGALFGSASAKDTKAMSYMNEWSSNLGLIVVPYTQPTGFGFLRYALSGGMNYTRLALADEYIDFVTSTNPVFFYPEPATGFGWYLGPEFDLVQKRGLLIQIGARFLQENPQYPRGTKAFAGSEILGSLGLGYKF